MRPVLLPATDRGGGLEAVHARHLHVEQDTANCSRSAAGSASWPDAAVTILAPSGSRSSLEGEQVLGVSSTIRTLAAPSARSARLPVPRVVQLGRHASPGRTRPVARSDRRLSVEPVEARGAVPSDRVSRDPSSEYRGTRRPVQVGPGDSRSQGTSLAMTVAVPAAGPNHRRPVRVTARHKERCVSPGFRWSALGAVVAALALVLALREAAVDRGDARCGDPTPADPPAPRLGGRPDRRHLSGYVLPGRAQVAAGRPRGLLERARRHRAGALPANRAEPSPSEDLGTPGRRVVRKIVSARVDRSLARAPRSGPRAGGRGR